MPGSGSWPGRRMKRIRFPSGEEAGIPNRRVASCPGINCVRDFPLGIDQIELIMVALLRGHRRRDAACRPVAASRGCSRNR